MTDYKIKCEVVKILNGIDVCPGSAKSRVGDTFILGVTTPEGICARAFASIYPVSLAQRFAEEIPWERSRGYFEVICPDSQAVFRLSRIKEE